MSRAHNDCKKTLTEVLIEQTIEAEVRRYGDGNFFPLPPGRSIAMLLEDSGGTHEWLAEKLGLSLAELVDLIAGQRPLTDDIAKRLARCFALPAGWWLDQERQWRESL